MTSVTATLPGPRAAASPAQARLRTERRFFSGMAIAMFLVCFAGFAPSYYLKAHFGTRGLSPLIHVHGAIFTMWMLLLLTQTSLVAAGRVKLHRQLGMGGAVLAVAMIVSAAAVVLVRGKTVSPGMPHEMLLAFLAIPTVALIIFPTLIGAALYLRRDTGAHKRLIMLATSVFLTAAVHRLLMIVVSPTVSPPVFFAASDLFLVAIAVYDFATRRRIHPATLWGGLLIVVTQLGTMFLMGSRVWLTFAHWVTGT